MDIILSASQNISVLAENGGVKCVRHHASPRRRRTTTGPREGECESEDAAVVHDDATCGKANSVLTYQSIEPMRIKSETVNNTYKKCGVHARYLFDTIGSADGKASGAAAAQSSATQPPQLCSSPKPKQLDLVVGRDPSLCDVVLPLPLEKGPLMSRKHCTIHLRLVQPTQQAASGRDTDGSCVVIVEDHGSVNGTFLDGFRVPKGGCATSNPFNPLVDVGVAEGREPLCTISFGGGCKIPAGGPLPSMLLRLSLQVFVVAHWQRRSAEPHWPWFKTNGLDWWLSMMAARVEEENDNKFLPIANVSSAQRAEVVEEERTRVYCASSAPCEGAASTLHSNGSHKEGEKGEESHTALAAAPLDNDRSVMPTATTDATATRSHRTLDASSALLNRTLTSVQASQPHVKESLVGRTTTFVSENRRRSTADEVLSSIMQQHSEIRGDGLLRRDTVMNPPAREADASEQVCSGPISMGDVLQVEASFAASQYQQTTAATPSESVAALHGHIVAGIPATPSLGLAVVLPTQAEEGVTATAAAAAAGDLLGGSCVDDDATARSLLVASSKSNKSSVCGREEEEEGMDDTPVLLLRRSVPAPRPQMVTAVGAEAPPSEPQVDLDKQSSALGPVQEKQRDRSATPLSQIIQLTPPPAPLPRMAVVKSEKCDVVKEGATNAAPSDKRVFRFDVQQPVEIVSVTPECSTKDDAGQQNAPHRERKVVAFHSSDFIEIECTPAVCATPPPPPSPSSSALPTGGSSSNSTKPITGTAGLTQRKGKRGKLVPDAADTVALFMQELQRENPSGLDSSKTTADTKLVKSLADTIKAGITLADCITPGLGDTKYGKEDEDEDDVALGDLLNLQGADINDSRISVSQNKMLLGHEEKGDKEKVEDHVRFSHQIDMIDHLGDGLSLGHIHTNDDRRTTTASTVLLTPRSTVGVFQRATVFPDQGSILLSDQQGHSVGEAELPSTMGWFGPQSQFVFISSPDELRRLSADEEMLLPAAASKEHNGGSSFSQLDLTHWGTAGGQTTGINKKTFARGKHMRKANTIAEALLQQSSQAIRPDEVPPSGSNVSSVLRRAVLYSQQVGTHAAAHPELPHHHHRGGEEVLIADAAARKPKGKARVSTKRMTEAERRQHRIKMVMSAIDRGTAQLDASQDNGVTGPRGDRVTKASLSLHLLDPSDNAVPQRQLASRASPFDKNFTTVSSRLVNAGHERLPAIFAPQSLCKLLHRHQWEGVLFIWRQLMREPFTKERMSAVTAAAAAGTTNKKGAGGLTAFAEAAVMKKRRRGRDEVATEQTSDDKGNKRRPYQPMSTVADGLRRLSPRPTTPQVSEGGEQHDISHPGRFPHASQEEAIPPTALAAGQLVEEDALDATVPRGCVLAHEMGLGKTLTTIAFLLLMWMFRRTHPTAVASPPIFRTRGARTVIAVPKSVLLQWARELGRWTHRAGESEPITVFLLSADHHAGAKEKYNLLRQWASAPEDRTILLTTHTLLASIINRRETRRGQQQPAEPRVGVVGEDGGVPLMDAPESRNGAKKRSRSGSRLRGAKGPARQHRDGKEESFWIDEMSTSSSSSEHDEADDDGNVHRDDANKGIAPLPAALGATLSDDEDFITDRTAPAPAPSPVPAQRTSVKVGSEEEVAAEALPDDLLDACRSLLMNHTALLIIDEGHKISHVRSALSKALQGFPPGMLRLALSGTPARTLEKPRAADELYALLHFIMPGVWTERRDLKAQPQRQLRDVEALMHTCSMADLANELPLLIETTFVFDLSAAQASMFRELVQCMSSPEPGHHEAVVPPRRRLAFTTRAMLISNHCDLVQDWCRRQGIDEHSAMDDVEAYERSHEPHDSVAWAVPSFLIPPVLRSANLHPAVEEADDDAMAMREATLASLEYSWKMRGLFHLLHAALVRGEKVLIFSHSLKTLILIGLVMQRSSQYVDGEDFALISGTLHARRREELCKAFNDRNNALSVLLLPFQSCGVGLDLPAADRVILYDTSANPLSEKQAIGRAFRLGSAAYLPDGEPGAKPQRRAVYVNRLLSNEPVELRDIPPTTFRRLARLLDAGWLRAHGLPAPGSDRKRKGTPLHTQLAQLQQFVEDMVGFGIHSDPYVVAAKRGRGSNGVGGGGGGGANAPRPTLPCMSRALKPPRGRSTSPVPPRAEGGDRASLLCPPALPTRRQRSHSPIPPPAENARTDAAAGPFGMVRMQGYIDKTAKNRQERAECFRAMGTAADDLEEGEPGEDPVAVALTRGQLDFLAASFPDCRTGFPISES